MAAAEDPTAVCLESHESAQLARADGDLLASRKHLLACLYPECPAIVQKDCGGWLEEVQRDLPTVIVAARRDEVDLDAAELRIDGQPFALGGLEIPLNPGRHLFRASLPSGETKEQSVLLAVGERGRRVVFEWTTPRPVIENVAPGPPERAARTTRPVPSSVWVALGVGGAGLATGAVLGTIALVEKDGLSCAPFCSSGARGSIDDKLLAADVGFGVGVLGLLAAGTLYWLRPEVPEASASWSVEMQSVPGGGAIECRGRF